jgi:hypothetical protein
LVNDGTLRLFVRRPLKLKATGSIAPTANKQL